MLGYQLRGDGEPHANSVWFAGDTGPEDAVSIFLRHARPGIIQMTLIR